MDRFPPLAGHPFNQDDCLSSFVKVLRRSKESITLVVHVFEIVKGRP